MTTAIISITALLLGLIAGYLLGERSGRNTHDELVEALEHALTLARAGKTGAPFLTAWQRATALFNRTTEV